MLRNPFLHALILVTFVLFPGVLQALEDENAPGPSSLPVSSGSTGEADVPGTNGFSGPGTDIRRTLQEMGARVSDAEIRMDLSGDVLFDTNRYKVRPDAREALARVARVLRAYPGKTVLVEGHTDFEGSQVYNRQLSVKRAESVRQWLRDKEGLTETAFQIKGWGKLRPRASNRTEEGRQENRRVEVTILTEP